MAINRLARAFETSQHCISQIIETETTLKNWRARRSTKAA
jgi:hypothetical protein